MTAGSRTPSAYQDVDVGRRIALVAFGSIGFVVWLGVALLVPPERMLTYVAFLVPLWTFVTCFTSVALQWLVPSFGLRRPGTMTSSVRLGGLVATVLTANLALAAAHRWAFIQLPASMGLALGVDLVFRFRSTAELGRRKGKLKPSG